VESEADVVAGVRLASQLKLSVSVRSGGHSFEAWSVQNDTILLDLGGFKAVRMNQATLGVSVTPSVTSKELDDVLQMHGLFFPGGHCPDVGMGGFLLQGGMGWNCGNWGWGAEFVQAVDVVTARGQLLHCNPTQNSDLYWAARGAGPAFPGIVTCFHLQVLRRPSVIRSSGYVFPKQLYPQAFAWALRLQHELDSDTEITAKSQYRHGLLCFAIFLTTFKDAPEDAVRALQAAQDSRPAGTLAEWFCQLDSMDNLYRIQSQANPGNHRYRVDSGFLDSTADMVSTLAKPFLTLPHSKSFAFWTSMYPWSRRQLPDMALSLQADHYFAVYTIWEEAADDARCMAWLDTVMQSTRASTIGAYLGDSHFDNDLRRYWTQQNLRRLQALCQRWDPDGRVKGGYPAVKDAAYAPMERAGNL
ncbi:hypothetical protein KXV80_004975, partial [Aspergillus fumigatus]